MGTIAKVRKIGNSRGILFPKTVLEESGIKGTVEITVKDNRIIIKPTDYKKAKKKWSDFKRAKRTKAAFIVNNFDLDDWTW